MLLSWKKKRSKPTHNPPSCPDLCQHNLKHLWHLLIDFNVKTQAGYNLGLASMQRLVWLVPQLANVLCLSLSHPLFFSSQGCSWYLAFHDNFSFSSVPWKSSIVATKKWSLTYTFVFQEMQTLLSSALPAAVAVAMGADLHPAVPGDTLSYGTQQLWNNRDTAFMEKHRRFSTTANHFMVFHQKITFPRTPAVARTDPTVTENLFHLQLVSITPTLPLKSMTFPSTSPSLYNYVLIKYAANHLLHYMVRSDTWPQKHYWQIKSRNISGILPST